MPHPDITPPGIHPGDTIGIVSPSARFNDKLPDALNRSVALLQSLGFRTKVFWTPDPSPSPIRTRAAHRLAELRSAFADREVSAIVCSSGGSTANELLPELLKPPRSRRHRCRRGGNDGNDDGGNESEKDDDIMSVVRANPKPFVGYSDITVLHHALAARAGLRTFYGPTAIQELGEAPEPLALTLESLLRTILTPGPDQESSLPPPYNAPYALPRSPTYAPTAVPFLRLGPATSTEARDASLPAPPWVWLRRGQARGPLFGGCLPVLVRLQGVPGLQSRRWVWGRGGGNGSYEEEEEEDYDDWAGNILFVETPAANGSLDAPYLLDRLRQNLVDLVAQKVLDGVGGLVVGRCVGYDDERSRRAMETVVKDVVCPDVGADGWDRGRDREDGDETSGLESGDVTRTPRRRAKFPVLLNVDIGHTGPMVTLPMGALASLDSEKDTFRILEPPVL
ncbi:hypothetical protein VTK73DRAFT_7950 [Phialemonium thermophilum]|uniref:LD-carboxypeptidase n=1 Tax=Phialemonium thermophilum TaxID=223376 RepID=A0ABR3XRA3_9PEZI